MKRSVLFLVAGVALAGCQKPAKDPLFMNIDVVCVLDDPYGEGRRYSIDHDRRRWCATGPQCAATTGQIASADEVAVALTRGADRVKLEHATGRIEGVEGGRPIAGVCTRTPFTPMG